MTTNDNGFNSLSKQEQNDFLLASEEYNDEIVDEENSGERKGGCLENNFVYIRYDDDGIFCKDKTDVYNIPCTMTKSKRGVVKAWDMLIARFNDSTKFGDANDIIGIFVQKVHYWCAMD